MSLKEQTLTATLWSLTQRWSARFWGLIVFFILARLLGPESFGLIALASVFIDVGSIFIGEGFVKPLVQRRDLEPEHLSTAFWSNVVTGIVLTTLVFTASPIIASLAGQPELAAILRWLSLSFVINSFSNVQSALLERELAYKTLTIRTLTGLVAGGVVG